MGAELWEAPSPWDVKIAGEGSHPKPRRNLAAFPADDLSAMILG